MMRVLPCGEHALLLEVDTAEQRTDLLHRLEHARPDGVAEVVPGARTVLLVLDTNAEADDVERVIRTLPAPPPAVDDDGELVTIPVTYDGPDLAEVAEHLGCSREDVVRRHCEQTWTCEFVGFLPGFGYLTPDEYAFDVPRRESPRSRIPAGSVALAAGWSAVYPSSSPGGWQLIGRTDHPMFDPSATPPSQLRAGTRVRFVATTSAPESACLARPSGAGPSQHADPARAPGGLVVERVEFMALVEDAGRPGHRHLGVPPSGAADRASLAAGNDLLGNPRGAAGIEVTLGGLVVRATTTVLVAVTGAPAEVTVDGAPASFGTALSLTAGQRLEIGRVTSGLRCYLTACGGVLESDSMPMVLASLSSDPTSGLGPAPLRAGVRLTVGLPIDEPHLETVVPSVPDPHDGIEVSATWGPRADWLPDDARRAFATSTWTVSDQTDRVGIRLNGPAAQVNRATQLPSEGLVRGSVQVPPDGTPIVFLADHPTTGGYPVVAVIDNADTDRLAQAPPGTPIRLRVG